METWDGRGGGQARAPAKPLPSPGTAPSIWPSCRRPSAGSAHGSSVSARDRYIRHHSFWYAFESRDAVWIRMWPATRCTCECCSICTAWTDASVGGAGCGSDANREAASDPYHLKPRQVDSEWKTEDTREPGTINQKSIADRISLAVCTRLAWRLGRRRHCALDPPTPAGAR